MVLSSLGSNLVCELFLLLTYMALNSISRKEVPVVVIILQMIS